VIGIGGGVTFNSGLTKADGTTPVDSRRLAALEAIAAAVASSYEYLTERGYPTSSLVRERLAALAALGGSPTEDQKR
jgi:hypothetical protein